MLASFYRPVGQRVKILIEAGAFSSDRHAVASQLAWHGQDVRSALIELTPAAGAEVIPEDAIEACLEQHGEKSRWCCGPECSFELARRLILRESYAPRTARAALPAWISRIP